MPNWCNNQITITGPNSVIDKIEKIVKEEENIDLSSKEKGETPGLLQFMAPMPAELLETEAGPIAKTKKEKKGQTEKDVRVRRNKLVRLASEQLGNQVGFV